MRAALGGALCVAERKGPSLLCLQESASGCGFGCVCRCSSGSAAGHQSADNAARVILQCRLSRASSSAGHTIANGHLCR